MKKAGQKFKTLKTNSSKMWLRRTESDPFVKMRHREGYRSRAAYKLLEVDDKYHFLSRSKSIVELGSAPGSWTQVVAQRCTGRCISIDLTFIQPVHSPAVDIKYMTGDFTSKTVLEQMMTELNGKHVDLVLSDMAPNTTGIKELDHSRIIDLVTIAFDFTQKVLKRNGTFFFKSFAGGEEVHFKNKLKEKFDKVLPIKPESSRDHSSEVYFLCLGFKRDDPPRETKIENK